MSRLSRPWWSLLWRRSILPFTKPSSGGAGLMSVHIDINCDMGESYGRWTLGADEEIMPNIPSANIACGFHGGDPHVMRRSVELAVQHGVAVGAHPGLPDLMGFGRRRMDVSPQEIKDIHRYQVGALYGFAKAAGTTLQHVKAHGIQYHMFEENLPLGRASAEQVVELDPNLILMTMAMTRYDAEARKVKGCRVAPGHGHRHQDERSEEHTSELQSRSDLVCRLLLEKKKKQT